MKTAKKHPTVAMNAVKSGQIKSIGHDAATNTLAVEFKSGGIYHYHDVPAAKFHELTAAESIGSHLGKHIKGAHKFTKLETK